MPLVIHPRVRKGLCRLATMTAVGMFATTGVAAADTSASTTAPCPPQATTTPFTQYGDSNSYFPLPGGTFQGTSLFNLGWGGSGALLSAVTDPLTGKVGDQALTVLGNGYAASPVFCLDATMPSLRFFARQQAGGSDLKVWLVVRNGTQYGSATVDQATTLSDGSMPSWGLTAPIGLASSLNIPAGQSVSAQLYFQVPSWGSSWQLDDVYVDPYRY